MAILQDPRPDASQEGPLINMGILCLYHGILGLYLGSLV